MEKRRLSGTLGLILAGHCNHASGIPFSLLGQNIVPDDFQLIYFMTVSDHKRQPCVRLGELLQESARRQHVDRVEVLVCDANLSRKQTRHVEIVDPEKRNFERCLEHRHRDVGRQNERRSGTVSGEIVVRVFDN